MNRYITNILSALILFYTGINAQDSYRLDPSGSFIMVEGTSSLHDWEMESRVMSARVELAREGNRINKISDVRFSMNAEDLKSHNSIMDSKAQDALKSGRFPQIKFDLQSVTAFRHSTESFSGTANGNLSLAGKTRQISFPFRGSLNGNSSMTVIGNEKIRMTDFGIKPPTAMLGTLKTGDEINVKFQFEFVR